MKAAIYIRVSTEDQALKGESLELQKERILEYIKIRDWKLFSKNIKNEIGRNKQFISKVLYLLLRVK